MQIILLKSYTFKSQDYKIKLIFDNVFFDVEFKNDMILVLLTLKILKLEKHKKTKVCQWKMIHHCYRDNLRDSPFQRLKCTTSGRAVLRSKLVDGKCQVQSPVALVDLAVRSFPWFSPKLA